ncbi:MAG: DUF4159 domain-containing protein [Gemmatimonadota bacterium]|nr:DUF4159 domain-containing protein [Gemmatimonadota bacterium]
MTRSRRAFLESLAGALVLAPFAAAAQVRDQARAGARAQGGLRRGGAPTGGEFEFARLRYDSGDWDYNPKVAANVLDAVMQYTTIPVQQQEVVVSADSTELDAFPFLFMTGHKLVRFSERERRGLARFVGNGGLLFSDDCNHDVNGLYARSFEAEMRRTFPGAGTLAKVPASHAIYRSFFLFDGPPRTSHEINGWGDNVVHDYVRGVEHNGRLGVVYTNQDYGCEWDYSWRNKRFRTKDNTKFAVNLVVYAMT